MNEIMRDLPHGETRATGPLAALAAEVLRLRKWRITIQALTGRGVQARSFLFDSLSGTMWVIPADDKSRPAHSRAMHRL
jgi:hypothetical protein